MCTAAPSGKRICPCARPRSTAPSLPRAPVLPWRHWDAADCNPGVQPGAGRWRDCLGHAGPGCPGAWSATSVASAAAVFPGLVVIRSNQASLADTLDLLEQPMPEHARQGDVPPLVFERNIRLDDVYFRYSPESDWVLRGVSLEIPKGRRVGVMGETGCGKSTMLDIVMGLLSPTSGSLAVDGVVIGADNGNGWQAHIAHVPQSVFLADSSIASNIALASLSMR